MFALLVLAADEYHRLLSIGEWTGVQSKSSQPAFYTQVGIKCFNCSKNHRLPDFPKPHNRAQIKKNKKAHFDGKRNGKSKNIPTKQKPPTDTEKKNGNTRVIDGVPMYYHNKKKCWLVKKNSEKSDNETPNPTSPEANTAAANPAVETAGENSDQDQRYSRAQV